MRRASSPARSSDARAPSIVPGCAPLVLAVAPGTLDRLADAVLAPGTPAERIRAVYWDSARCALGRRGYALCVEDSGGGRLQRLEGIAARADGAGQTVQPPAPISGCEPEPARIAPAAVRRLAVRSALRPVFTLEFERRTGRIVPAADSAIELRFDRGAIRADGRRERLCEIELEARHGPFWRLYEAALALEARAPLQVEARSRAARGYALARRLQPLPVKAGVAVVRDAMSVLEAFRAIGFVCLAHLNANRQGMLAAADPEFLHQMRVALRRLRSAFTVFARALPEAATAPALAEVRWLLGALGPARDWDVLSEGLLASLRAREPAHPGWVAIGRAVEARRAAAQRAARRAVGSRRYTRFVLGLGAWLSGEPWLALLPLEQARRLRRPVREYARQTLARRYRQVRKRGRGLTGLDAEALHRLRIAVKKLRYTAQFFAPLYSARRAAAMRRALEALQDALGAINDCATAARLVAEACAGVRAARLREAQALFERANERALAAHRRGLKAAWRAFRAADRYWE